MIKIEKIMTRAIDVLRESTEKLDEPIIVSDCCGSEPIENSEDLGICPSCFEHCEYININTED